MISRLTDIKDRVIIGCLSGRCQHCGNAALKFRDLFSDRIVGRILQSCVKISFLFQIKQSAHLITGIIFKRCTLIDWKDPRLPLLWLPA